MYHLRDFRVREWTRNNYTWLWPRVPSVSFRPAYTGRDTAGLLLTKKPQITPKEFPIAPKPLFKLFVWQQLPSIFLQADSSDNSCVLFFLFFFFPFSSSHFCGERGHFATSSTRTLFLYSSVCRWNGNNDKTATSVSHVKRWSLLLWTTGAQFGTFS